MPLSKGEKLTKANLDVFGGKFVKLAVGFLRRGLLENHGFQVLIQFLGQSRLVKVSVLGHDVGGECIAMILAVQQQQVTKRLGRARRIANQKIKLSKPEKIDLNQSFYSVTGAVKGDRGRG